jgi:predicted permease
MSITSGDLRYALRSMRTNPGFTVIAVASLALGIGVNTVVFSLVDQLLLWSVPARDPGRLVAIQGGRSTSYPFYREYRDRNQVFSDMFASSRPMTAGVRPEGAPAAEPEHVAYVSGNYFGALGIGAAAGRVIASSDDVKPGGSPVAVLSYSYWQRRFAGDLGVIGRTLAVNGYPLEIAGIAERGFTGLFKGRPADAFIPLTMFPVTTPASAAVWNTPNVNLLSAMARLKPGVTREQAQAGMRVLWPQVAEAVSDEVAKAGGRRRKYKEDQIRLLPGAHGVSFGPDAMLDPLKTLSIATGLVLLIACANVANLLLARATGRRKEIAVRLAVGATRGRLVRQLLSESLVLAVAGGAIGLALAHWGVLALAKASLVDPDLRFQPNLKVAAFSAGVTLLTGILFGLVPAFRASRIGLSGSMKDGGSAGQGGSRLRLGKALIAGQVALSLTLLVGAGLFIRTLRNLESIDIGFDRENVILVDVDPTNLGYKGHRLRTFYDQLLERTRHLPGVRSAALSHMTPMGENSRVRTFSAEGYVPKPDENLMAYSNPVTSGYFRTFGVPMLLGRDFQQGDEPAATPGDSVMAALGRLSGGFSEMPASASRVCIVNESFARHLFGGANPVGRRLSYEDRYTAEGAIEIVGVVKDIRHETIRQSDETGMIYVPSWSNGAEARRLAVRLTGKPAPVVAAIRRELRDSDPNVPVLRTRPLEEYVNGSLGRERLIAYLSGFFGILALGLASVGLYGVVAYSVTQRTKEVGIRMALGAQRGDVVRMIVGESLVPVLFGIGIGLAGALALTRLVAGLLYGVAPRDPVSIIVAAGALLAVSLTAAALPARRCSRVEPLTALRYE